MSNTKPKTSRHKCWMVVALKEDCDGDPHFDPDMNECLETTYYSQTEAEEAAKEAASEYEQPHCVMQTVSVFTPQKRPVKKTTIK